MTRRPARGVGGTPNILLGVVRLATGRADGLAHFGNTTQAFLTSLAPLIAFPLVGGALLIANGGGLPALSDLLATLCALLAPPVLSWWFARRWQREALWPRFATAFNWCQWAIPVMASILLVVLGLLMAVGLPNRVAGVVALLGLVSYGLWLHWFLACRGLGLSVARAVLFVVCVNFGTAALVVGPRLLMAIVSPDQG
ncbi:MAG TPA: hypothetical protein VLJ20_07835 [Acetobacteraceae bacterium]|nr:hypothetical protein [Acetobacteraceae bacterium]